MSEFTQLYLELALDMVKKAYTAHVKDCPPDYNRSPFHDRSEIWRVEGNIILEIESKIEVLLNG